MYQIEYPCCPDMSELLVVSRYNITKLKSAGGACLPISCLKVKTAQASCGWQFVGLWGTGTQWGKHRGREWIKVVFFCMQERAPPSLVPLAPSLVD